MVESVDRATQHAWTASTDLHQRIDALEQALADCQRELEAAHVRAHTYRDILDHIPDFIVQFDRELRHVFINGALLATPCFPDGEECYLGKTHAELPYTGTQWVDFWTTQLRKVFASGEPLRLDVYSDDPHNPYVFDWRLIPEFDADGCVETVLTISTEIGDRTRELARANHAWQTESAILASSINLLPLPVFFITTECEITRANHAALEFFVGMDMAQWHTVAVAETGMSEEWTTLGEWLCARVLAGQVVHGEEAVIALPAGREVPVFAHGTPVIVGDTLVAAVVTLQDVTMLKAADRAKDQFLALLSHELRNPLTNVLAWTDVARTGDDHALTHRALDVVARNARQLHMLVNDLLDVSSIVYRKMTITPRKVDLWTLTVHAMENYRHLLTEKALCCEWCAPAVALNVMGDGQRLAQVMDNLLTNAIRYTEGPGVITVCGEARGGIAILSITDTGCGMTSEMIDTIFRPFQRHDGKHIPGALGLGLALVKGIIELHGGRVTAASPGPGAGSTIAIELPMHE